MKARTAASNDPPEPAQGALLPAKFLAMREEFQVLEAEIADWNVKKAKLKKSRRWKKKCQLIPPSLRAATPARPSGAQEGNENHRTHGKRTRSKLLFRALIRTHIRSGKVLVTAVRAEAKKARQAARASHTPPAIAALAPLGHAPRSSSQP